MCISDTRANMKTEICSPYILPCIKAVKLINYTEISGRGNKETHTHLNTKACNDKI